jgi:hypothetical protein
MTSPDFGPSKPKPRIPALMVKKIVDHWLGFLEDYEEVILVFRRSLDPELLQSKNVEWPEDGCAMKQDITTPRGVQSLSKRSKLYYGKDNRNESSQKWLYMA